MRIFVSWSGARSLRVAALLKDWLPVVIQSVNPWLSAQDIASGSRWFEEISGQLSTVSQGIICLTRENKDRPWILFEAGALSNGFSRDRVHIFLVDLEQSDVRPPLSHFNLTLPTKERVRHLLISINNSLESKLADAVLERAFEASWPTFESGFRAALSETNESTSQSPTPREPNDILEEVLVTVRALDNKISIESAKGSYGPKMTGDELRAAMWGRVRASMMAYIYLGYQACYEKVFTSIAGEYKKLLESQGYDAFKAAFDDLTDDLKGATPLVIPHVNANQQNTDS